MNFVYLILELDISLCVKILDIDIVHFPYRRFNVRFVIYEHNKCLHERRLKD